MFSTGTFNEPWMLRNCPSLSAAPLILDSLSTKRRTLASDMNTERESDMLLPRRTYSDAAPYERLAARPVSHVSVVASGGGKSSSQTAVMHQAAQPARWNF